MDNLPAHKLAPPCARLSRPPTPNCDSCRPYSLDLNPIEMAFAKFKAFLNQLAARTLDDLWHAIGHALDIFTPSECRNSFAAVGFEPE